MDNPLFFYPKGYNYVVFARVKDFFPLTEFFLLALLVGVVGVDPFCLRELKLIVDTQVSCGDDIRES